MTSAPKELCERFPVYTHHLSKFEELKDLAFPTSHTILLIAANYEAIGSKEISDTATALLSRGNAYLASWGENAEKAETIWDAAARRLETQKKLDFHFVATSHEEETLEEAAWYALNCAFVDEEIESATSVVLISIGHPEWQNTIDNIREDPTAFNERSLEDEGDDNPGSNTLLRGFRQK
ncbi:MAG: hypothetical protein AAGB46_06830 [Verrucomicrobiota bacterium]